MWRSLTQRLLHNRIYWIATMVLFLLIMSETFKDMHQGLHYNYVFMTFLAGNSEGHMASKLVLWVMPLYLCLGPAIWASTDHKSRYNVYVTSRNSRFKASQSYYSFVFVSEFGRWLVLLLLNLLFCALFLSHKPGFAAMLASGVPSFARYWPWAGWQLYHQLPAILILSVIVALVAAVLAVGVASLGTLLQNKYYTAFVALALWVVLTTGSSTTLSGLQAYVEFNAGLVLLHTLVLFLIIALVWGAASLQEVRSDLL